MKQIGFFDESNRLEELSKLGDSLEKLNGVMNWRLFLPTIERALKKEPKGAGGRPAYSYEMMFKILVLKRLFNLSDDQTEYQIKDRLSFMRFLGLSISDRVPDAKTIWLFQENLTKADVIEELFNLFGEQLETGGLITRTGSIVDATFVDAPRQRNSRDENKEIKEGKIPEEWKDPKNIYKLRQKDTDARWAKKGEETHFGYKSHTKVDKDSKLITKYSVTSAEVHDSQEFVDLIDQKDKEMYGDSAFVGQELHEKVKGKFPNIVLKIHEKGYKNRPLNDEQKASNHKKSKIRCRIEHAFGFITNSMNGINLRTIGIKRAKFNIGLTNLVYNMCRFRFLKHSVKKPRIVITNFT